MLPRSLSGKDAIVPSQPGFQPHPNSSQSKDLGSPPTKVELTR
jgi:hypothetical protein